MDSIIAENISKTYGTVKALKEVSLTVQKGELFGLIGADGAGKTTLFRILASLILPDAGKASVEGLDPVSDYRRLRCITGYMPGRFSLYGDLTVEENIRFYATVFGTTLEAGRVLIDDIYKQLEPFRNRAASRLSGGMKQKLALCCALIHSPSVLFLDEPTTGVDPVSRREFWLVLKHLRESGMTVMVSTPYMEEAGQCGRIAFIKEGSILYSETPGRIVESFGETLYAVSSDRMHTLLDDVRSFTGIKYCYSFGDSHHFVVDESFSGEKALACYLAGIGYGNITVKKIQPTMEDCYMKLSLR